MTEPKQFRPVGSVWFNSYHEQDWYKKLLSYLRSRYSAIEQRFLETFRYVDLDRVNAHTSSYEYASILRDVGSVFSSTMDSLVRNTHVVEAKRRYDIKDYRSYFSKTLNEKAVLASPFEEIVVSPNRNVPMFLNPFRGWREKDDPEWWIAYNHEKHNDVDHVHEGNLKNTLNAFAGLTIVYWLADGQQKPTFMYSVAFIYPSDEDDDFLFFPKSSSTVFTQGENLA